MTSEMTAKAFKALSDPTRLHIVEFLGSACCGQAEVAEDGGVIDPTAGEVCCHITGAEKITSTISHHLHELESAGLITLRRQGKTTLCRLNPEKFEELAEGLKELATGRSNRPCC